MSQFQKRIFVAGHRGMVGSAIVRCLAEQGYSKLITRSHAELDLTDQAQVRAFFAEAKPTRPILKSPPATSMSAPAKTSRSRNSPAW